MPYHSLFVNEKATMNTNHLLKVFQNFNKYIYHIYYQNGNY